MPTSNYMPNTVVHIAFDSGFLTPAASRTWTDVSDYVEFASGFTITGGRGDERSQADANTLSGLKLINDGRFTPFKTGGAYYPNVKLDRPIRVTSTPVDGGAQVEFLGFISDWGVDWSDGTDATSYATVSAQSRLARLGMVAGLKSIVETAILMDAPTAYYTLGEPEGSLWANDSSGNKADPLVLTDDPLFPVVFGTATGPGTDGLSAATFAGDPTADVRGQYLSGTAPSVAASVDFFFLVPTVPTLGDMVLVNYGGGQAILSVDDTTGLLLVNGASASVTSVADNLTHHAAMTFSGGQIHVYLDGVNVANAVVSAPTGTSLELGGAVAVGTGARVNLKGVLAHVATYSTVLSAPQVASHASAGLTGYAGDTTSARLIRYAGFGGVETAAIVAETGQTTVQHVDSNDQPALELMRLMEATEGGVLFDDRDGTTAFHNRAHRLTAASAFTLDMAQQMVESDYEPKLDRTGLANDISAQDITGKYTAHVFDAQSRNVDNGPATMSIETASEDDDEPLFQVSWALYKYKSPKLRIATLSCNALAQVGKTPNCATVMAANVGTKITVSNAPSQDSTTTATYFVEGYTKVYGPESLFITWNVSPSSPEDTTYICGDATRGVIGTNPIAL